MNWQKELQSCRCQHETYILY